MLENPTNVNQCKNRKTMVGREIVLHAQLQTTHTTRKRWVQSSRPLCAHFQWVEMCN